MIRAKYSALARAQKSIDSKFDGRNQAVVWKSSQIFPSIATLQSSKVSGLKREERSGLFVFRCDGVGLEAGESHPALYLFISHKQVPHKSRAIVFRHHHRYAE